MAEHTPIEWVKALAAARNAIPATWNPTDGCSRASDGCQHCYAAALVHQLLSRSLPGRYAGLTDMDPHGTPRFNGTIRLAEHVLGQPLRARRQRVYFVSDMADLFHPSVETAWLDRIFATMALCPQHLFLVLTKRPERMRDYIAALPKRRMDCDAGLDWCDWPLPNVWLGVTVESQGMAEARIPHLLETPAAVRFLSCEPLLGPLSLQWIATAGTGGLDALHGETEERETGTTVTGARLDWVIAGGESGPKARPMHPDWARSLRDQCEAAGVLFHFKQWGEWIPAAMVGFFGHERKPTVVMAPHAMIRVGKAGAGHLLDGVEHRAVPGVGVRHG